jgi:hypothetical protein
MLLKLHFEKITKRKIKVTSVLITRDRWRDLENRPIKPSSSTKCGEFLDNPETY